MKKVFIKIILMLLIFLIILNYKCLNIVNCEEKLDSSVTVTNDREPRIELIKSNKSNLIIILHDNEGINIGKSSVKFDGKDQKLELIEVNDGVYDKNGKRIKDLSDSSKYSGKKYDYGVKISSLNLTSSNKNVSVISYDYNGNCYLNETLKVKKLEKIDKDGGYYKVDRAPRTTSKIENNVLNIYAEDYSGIKTIKVLANKTNEEIYTFDATTNNTTEEMDDISSAQKKDGSTNKGYLKENILYPYYVTQAISLNKAKIEENKYKIRVLAEDISGISSEKTMIINLTFDAGNSSSVSSSSVSGSSVSISSVSSNSESNSSKSGGSESGSSESISIGTITSGNSIFEKKDANASKSTVKNMKIDPSNVTLTIGKLNVPRKER